MFSMDSASPITSSVFRFTPLLFAAVLLLAAACNKNPRHEEVLHVARADWAPDVKEGINAFMDRYHHTPNAYVVFDFDNTSAIFDVCEQTMVYQLKTMSFALPPDEFAEAIGYGLADVPPLCQDWLYDISHAYETLWNSYGPFSVNGLDTARQRVIQSDPQWLEFASKMGRFYLDVYNYVDDGKANDWLLLWFSGMTEDELYRLSLRSHEMYAAVPTSKDFWQGPSDIPSRLGPVRYDWVNGIQVTENIRELWRTLQANGIDVWVCSASLTANICAAIDMFGLHSYCRGVLGMMPSIDKDGRYRGGFDYGSATARLTSSDGWQQGTLPLGAQTAGVGKSVAIVNAIAPLYDHAGPLAGFMDATGDFNFCTEFASLRMVVCFNRADRTVCNGGGLIAELAIYQRDSLHLSLDKANNQGDTYYLLQGRDENGMRSFRPSNATLRYGESYEQLFANEQNHAQLAYMSAHNMSTQEVINRFCIRTENDDLGFTYGFLDHYAGYHSRK